MQIPQERICTKCDLTKSLDEFPKDPTGKYGRAAQCKACTRAYMQARTMQPKVAPEAKVCKRCEMLKPIEDFGRDKYGKDGYNTKCRACKQEESLSFQQNNRPQTRAATARWKANNPEKVSAYTQANKPKRSKQRKERHAANREKENAQNAVNYLLKKDEWRPTRQAWEADHAPERRARHIELYLLQDPEERRARDRDWRAANPDKVREKNTRSRARRKNAPINDLAEAQFEEVKIAFDYRCPYCPPDCKACRKKTHRLTKDHVTPYAHNGSNTLWNVVPVCLSCNSRKRTGPPPVPVQILLLTIAPSRKPKKKKDE